MLTTTFILQSNKNNEIKKYFNENAIPLFDIRYGNFSTFQDIFKYSIDNDIIVLFQLMLKIINGRVFSDQVWFLTSNKRV